MFLVWWILHFTCCHLPADDYVDAATEIIKLVNEAHVVSIELGDDRLGDEEWNLLSSAEKSSTSVIFICLINYQQLL